MRATGPEGLLPPDNRGRAGRHEQAHVHGQVQHHRGAGARAESRRHDDESHLGEEERPTGRLRSRRVSHLLFIRFFLSGPFHSTRAPSH